MKRLTAAVTVCVALLFATCQETKNDLNNPISEKDLYRKVGEEIPFETGMRWLDFHRRASVSGRVDSMSTANVPSSAITTMLASVENLVGVAFHYAIDDSGKNHILLIPVGESMELWPTMPGHVFIDGNTGLELSQQLAEVWAENFKTVHPTATWYHFFGKEVFDQMQALPYFHSVDIEPATNPEDMSQQLLLIIWNDDQISTGRTTTMHATVYDASNACPPCATR